MLEQLAPGVYAYLHSRSGWGYSNAGVIAASDTAMLVDTQYTLPMTRRLIAAIGDADLPPISTVVNTHPNGDHCWGNQLVTQAETIASAATAHSMPHDFPPELMSRLLSDEAQATAAGRYTRQHFGQFDFTGIKVAPPMRTFSGCLEVPLGNRTIVLIEVGPAHTEGDAIVYVPDSAVVFAGDILFTADHAVMWTGPLANWIAACDTILATGATRIVPGHGPIVSRAGVIEFRSYLEHVQAGLELRYRQGMPYWQAAMDIPLGQYKELPLRERLVATAAATYHHLGAPKAAPAEVLERMAQAYFDAT
ncbi:MBL fold metallo-hydrolase [Dactylosporangium sp. NPDC005572]|uniref:MBL fold metallo-hydrolase n=1 Tax=Dactylosporangium sp. NPDC005572 TaxID=3156889 RepID=UPI0033BB6319